MNAPPSRRLLFDGLNVSRWSREVFVAMKDGDVTAANCTCSIWDDLASTVANIGRLRKLVRENDDVVTLVETTGDLDRLAESDDRVGIIVGFQNLAAVEGSLANIDIFGRLGLRFAQLTYNTQNFIGSGCYESRDTGLTDFGRDIVAELNVHGIVIDLSHVGRRTAADAMDASEAPVVFSHVCPAGLLDHPRNRTDEELARVAGTGGVVGVTPFAWFLRGGAAATVDDYLDAVEYTINVAGEDHTAIGTDFTQGHDRAFLEWIVRDKGDGRVLVAQPLDELELVMARGFERIEDLRRLPDEMRRRGWGDARIEKVLWGNWRRVVGKVWKA